MMRQLVCTAPGTLAWRDVTEPALEGEGSALIRPVAVARCELDPLLVLAGPRGDGGFAVGHEAIGVVLEVGAGVTRVRPGDLVTCAFQLSCGRCPSCSRGRTALCDEYPILSDYGMQPLSGVEYGGMLADAVHVPHADAMLHTIPAGVDPAAIASVADNVADGYRAVVPHLAEQPGADVLVVCHGGPSIALYATLAALAAAAGTVTFESDDDRYLEAAAALGARAMRTDFGRRAGRWPIVVDCGSRLEGLHHSLDSTDSEGTLHTVGFYGEPMTPLPLLKLYTRGIRLFTGRVHSAAILPEVLDAIASGRLNPVAVPTTVIRWDDAPSRYLDDAIKLVVAR